MDNLFSSSYDPFRHEAETPLIEAISKQYEDEVIIYDKKNISKKKIIYIISCQNLNEKCLKMHSSRYFANKTTLSEEVLILEKLNILFNHLKNKDLSSSDLFARSLSSTWHALIKMQIKYHSLQKLTPLIYQKICELITLVKFYKVEKSEHTFGYYLERFVGQEWFPFPFIETLKKLHIEAQGLDERAPLLQIITQSQTALEALKTLC